MMEGRQWFWITIFMGAVSLTTGFCLGWISPDDGESRIQPPEKKTVEKIKLEGVKSKVKQKVKKEALPEEKPLTENSSKVEHSREEQLLSSEKMTELFSFIEKNKSASIEDLSRFKVKPKMRSLYDKLQAKGEHRGVESGLPPKILIDVLQSLLKNAGLQFNKHQRLGSGFIVRAYEEKIAKSLQDLGSNTIQLERELEVISLTDDFLEEILHILSDQQVEKLDSLSSEFSEWPLFLSPLTNAPVSRREITLEKLPEVQQGFSRELAREFGLDPEDADHYAAELFEGIQASLMFPQKREDIVEHHVSMGEAQIKMLRSLMKHPAIDEQKRKKILSTRYWVVPVLKN